VTTVGIGSLERRLRTGIGGPQQRWKPWRRNGNRAVEFRTLGVLVGGADEAPFEAPKI
jgi:hypothetical protein